MEDRLSMIKRLKEESGFIGMIESRKILSEYDFDYDKALHYLKTEYSPIIVLDGVSNKKG